jgi:MFS family permease
MPMKYLRPTDHITRTETEQGLSAVIYDGLATHALVTLTGGVFLVAYALGLGASNAVIGLIAAIPPLAELLQIPGVGIIERAGNRRLVAVVTSLAARFFWIPIALIPLMAGSRTGIPILIVCLAVYSSLSAIKHCSWKSWMRDLIPPEILGLFFSRRMALSFALGIALSLGAGFFLDFLRYDSSINPLLGYSALFLIGNAFGLIGTYFLAKTPEPKMTVREGIPLKNLLSEPFGDRNFRNLLIFLCIWSFAINLAAPFFTVYLLNRLSIDITLVIALSILSQFCSILSFSFWGNLADRYSNKSMLRLAGPLFIICLIAWPFTDMPGSHALTLSLLIVIHILMGISTAGVTLASSNIGLKLAPKGTATSYLASISIFSSLTAGCAPILGGLFVDYLAQCELSGNLIWTSPWFSFSIQAFQFQHFDFFFVVAFLIGLYALHRLVFVQEEGEVEEKIVIRAILAMNPREMRNFSTAGGLRNILRFPLTGFQHAGSTAPGENKVKKQE